MTPAPSQWLFDFLKQWERFRPTAYKPTKDDVWTCGYGHTEGVTATTTCTMAQALQWLHDDVQKAVAAVQAHVTKPLNQYQADALYSLAFNIKLAVVKSTLLNKLNAGDYAGAAAEIPKWDHQGRIELSGLRDRRRAEQAHFLGH